jgi:hypothetical protein
MRISSIAGALAAVAFAAPAARADVEADLKRDLVGWLGVSRSGLASECTDHYTDNTVAGGKVSGKVGERFAAGELVRVDNVKIGAFSGLEVNLSLVEPFRLTWKDGPYTVYDQRRCRVQLHFDVSREVRKDAAKARAAIAAAVSLHDHEEAAKADPAWNRRKVEAYPANWEATKKEWEGWKRSQQNRRVREKIEEIATQSDRILDYMPSDAKYLASFGAGAEARSDSWSDCESALEATFSTSGSGEDTRGWADGQYVAWAARLAMELSDCYVEE